MIPLTGESAVLPRVETTCLKQNSIALTLVQNQLTSIARSPTTNNSFTPGIRILQSRTQRRRSSVSSLCSLLKFEDDQLRKLSSRGSSVDELKLCLETKQLTKQCCSMENLENNSSPLWDDSREEEKDEETENCGTNSKCAAVASESKSLKFQINAEPKKARCKSRGSCRSKSKKRSKSRKSPKKKTNGKTSSKIPSVFERLANGKKNCNDQDKLVTSNSDMRKNSSIFYNSNRSTNNLLEIKRLQATYMPVLKPTHPKALLSLPKVALSNTSDGKNSQLQKSCHSIPTTTNNVTIISSRKSLDNIMKHNNKYSIKKVYLSEVQTQLVGGVPGAPPATPFPDEQTRIEYIPCLMDVKSQRAVKTKLEKIVTRLRLEEKQKKENEIKENQRKLKESLLQLKQQQRAEIYALNKVMTELENENFKRFMMKKEAVSMMGV